MCPRSVSSIQLALSLVHQRCHHHRQCYIIFDSPVLLTTGHMHPARAHVSATLLARFPGLTRADRLPAISISSRRQPHSYSKLTVHCSSAPRVVALACLPTAASGFQSQRPASCKSLEQELSQGLLAARSAGMQAAPTAVPGAVSAARSCRERKVCRALLLDRRVPVES